jgi:hypothetical protein
MQSRLLLFCAFQKADASAYWCEKFPQRAQKDSPFTNVNKPITQNQLRIFTRWIGLSIESS